MGKIGNQLKGPCYVLFVRSGMERKICLALRDSVFRKCPDCQDVEFFAPLFEKVFIRKGISKIETGVLFPGYVFIFGEISTRLYEVINDNSDVFCFLKSGTQLLQVPKEEWGLLGEICNENGVIEVSTVDFEKNDRIMVMSGPLKNLATKIVSVNKHKRIAFVEVQMMNRVNRIKLSFEFLKKLDKEA